MAQPIYFHDWVDYMEREGKRICQRMEEILAAQGKRDNPTIEDVQNAEKRARKELGLASC